VSKRIGFVVGVVVGTGTGMYIVTLEYQQHYWLLQVVVADIHTI
jgi:hypothetical protein